MSIDPAHPSPFALSAWVLEALSAEEAARVRGHLAQCERCRGELEAMQAAHARFRRDVLPRTLPGIREHLSWRRFWPGALLPTLALTAAALMMITVHHSPSPHEPRAKGGVAMQVFLHEPGGARPARDAERATAGDELRFVVEPDGLPYLLVASVDGTGAASVYFPFDGAQSAPLASAPRQELPGSVVLDEAPGPERIFALFSRHPLDGAAVRRLLLAVGAGGAEAIRATRSLPVAGADAQVSLLLEKVLP